MRDIEHECSNDDHEKLVPNLDRQLRELPDHVSHLFRQTQTKLETETVHAFRRLQGVVQLDLLEVCAPWDSPLVSAVKQQGGQAMAIGLHNGYDMSTKGGLVRAMKLVKKRKPRYVHISPPCFPWSPYQNCNQKTEKQRENLEAKQRMSRKLIQNCRKLCEFQLQQVQGHCGGTAVTDRHVGGEHPLRASSWDSTDMGKMANMCGGRFTVYGCQHGLIDPKSGLSLQKAWGWFSTMQPVREVLESKCSHPKGTHGLIEGGITAMTAVYPSLLCERFAKALMQTSFNVYSALRTHSAILAGNEGDTMDDDPESDEAKVDRLLGPSVGDVEPEPSIAPDEPDDEVEEQTSRHLSLLRKVHQNLGHPSNSVLERMLRDAGAPQEVLQQCRTFECQACLNKGGKAPSRPAVPPPTTNKWECVSVDTFWWRTHVDNPGPQVGVVGVSFFDEATDYHTAVIVRQGVGPTQHNISGEEFKKAFLEGWVRMLPVPKKLRYDEEGCFRSWDVADFLERMGIQLDPVAGEAPWQAGKHSRHLYTLKSMMTTLNLDMGAEASPDQVLALALQAKNELHAVRGYSPMQWAFGQNFQRISSFLQQYDHLPTSSAREVDMDFETSLQHELKARKIFLEEDSRRRVTRALRAQSRTLHEFVPGQLVYYYRLGRSKHKASNGKWWGPARVLCHEKTTPEMELQHVGSIVWISHNGVIIRCAPEQLRRVTRVMQHVDDELYGPRDFYGMFEQVVKQRKYLDLLPDMEEHGTSDAPEPDSETHVRIRARGKQSDSFLDRSNPDPEHGRPDEGGSREAEAPADREPEERTRESRDAEVERSSDSASGRDGRVGDESGEVQGPHLQRSPPARRVSGLREVAEHKTQDSRTASSAVHDLRTSTAREPISKERPEGDDPIRGEEDRGKRKRAECRSPSVLGGSKHGRGADRADGEQDECDGDATAGDECPDGEDRASSWIRDSDAARPSSAFEDRSRRSLRSRSPVNRRRVSFNDDVQFEPATPVLQVGDTEVISITMAVAPRDMHQVRKGQASFWEINRRPKQNAEVRFEKLNEEDQKRFTEAKQKEIDSFLKNEAIRICSMQGVERERVMQMRWILTWKRETDKNGQVVGQKPKARLIIKGYQDPDLTSLDRDAPTLSVLFRNLLLAQTASRKFRLAVGDIKTAFLQGDDTEEARRVFADPPPDVKENLGMKDTELFRLKKAVYGLLNAPKRWFEKLSRTLCDLGWVQHQLDKCMFLLYSDSDPHELIGMCGMHVDDLLCAGVGDKYENCVKQLRSKFPFGSWNYADSEVVTFCGCELFQDSEFHIYLGQEKFSQSICEIPLTRERKSELEDNITEQERTQMRQTLGGLNWRSTQSAPWLLATTSHLQGCVAHGKVKHLLEVNKLVRLSNKYGKHVMKFSAYVENPVIVTFADSSFASRHDGSSQGGQITLLMDEKVMHGHEASFSVLCWQSRRLRRVARSSTSAEVQMVGNGLDIHEFCKLALCGLTEKLNLRNPDPQIQGMRSCLITDSKNVYDG